MYIKTRQSGNLCKVGMLDIVVQLLHHGRLASPALPLSMSKTTSLKVRMHLFWFIVSQCSQSCLLRFMPKKAQTRHRSLCGIGLKA